jgi:hypothetical protein
MRRVFPRSSAAMRRAGGLLVLALAAAGPTTGCSSDSNVLAKVGDEKITTADFLEVARSGGERYPGPPDTARAMLLDDLVKRALLIAEARRQHLVPDSLLAASKRSTEDRLLLAELQTRIAPRTIEVSDAEVAEFHRWRAVQSHVQLIYVIDRAMLDAAQAELARGMDFRQVADQFNMRGVLPPGGDLGFQAPGALVGTLDDALRTAPVGRVVGPIPAEGRGWFLVRVLERQPRVQVPLAQEAPTLREMLRQRKQRRIATRAYDDLRQAYHVALDPRGGEVLFRRYNMRLDSTNAQPFSNPPPPSPGDAALPLAHYDDAHGQRAAFTLGEAVVDLRDPGQDHPNFKSIPSIEQWIESQLLRRIALIEARRRHLEQDPEVAKRVEQITDNGLLEIIYTREIASKATASPAEVRALFAARSDMFIRIDGAHLLVATLDDSAAAVRLADHAGHAPSLREAVAMAAPGAGVTDAQIRYPTDDPTWNLLRPSIVNMSPHDVRGPFPSGNRWIVIQLLSKDQGTQTFENLPMAIQQNIENAAAERNRELRLVEFTNELRRAYRPVIHRDRLARIPWPVEPAVAPAG